MKEPMTQKGYEKLQAELARLTKVDRPKNIAAIAEARAHGDLSENAEYHAAKERQSFIEGRIRELGAKIATAEVITMERGLVDSVVFGTTVDLCDVASQEKKRYTIVGHDEADMKNGTISIYSPVARALIGRQVGDCVKVATPAKTIEYEVERICFE